MKKIPIVFSFNDGYLMPATVCITSLLMNANKDTFYDIFILHSSDRLTEESKLKLLKLEEQFGHCHFNFIDVKDAFKDAFEVRGITIETYYRLLIPFVIEGYEKVIYSDVDIIFQDDISELINMDIDIMAGVAVMSEDISIQYRKSIGLTGESPYVNAGFLVFNMSNMPDYRAELDKLINKKLTFQDQDVINILFEGKIESLPIIYNFGYSKLKGLYSKNISAKVFHYNGKKPWNLDVPFGDLWWEYYRKSIVYNQDFYFNFIEENYKDFLLLIKMREILIKSKLLPAYRKLRKIF